MRKHIAALSIAALATFAGAAQAAGTNVSAGLASSAYSQSNAWSGFDAQSMFNGGKWNAGDNGVQWVQIDLQSVKQITGLSFTTEQLPDGLFSQDIYFSNSAIGADYGSLTPALSHSAFTTSDTTISFDFAATGARYVEIVANNATLSWVSLKDATVLAAVPEPETYAMMAAGLGFIGFISRRRRRKA
jgi:hypothetical protein